MSQAHYPWSRRVGIPTSPALSQPRAPTLPGLARQSCLDLYELDLATAQRSVLDLVGQGQPALEVPQVVGQAYSEHVDRDEKSQPHLVGHEPMAASRQAGQFTAYSPSSIHPRPL